MMRFELADKIVAKLLLWRQVAAQREELGRLSDEMLKDIGLSRAEATHEAHRHFWDTAPREKKCALETPLAELNLKYH